MKKTSNSIVSNTKEKRKNKLSKLKVSATVFALLCSSMLVMSGKQIEAEEVDYQGESFETGAYQHDASAPYGYNFSQNSPYASTKTNKVNWTFSLPYEEKTGSSIKQFWGKPAIDKDGTVYMNNQNGYMYAINPDGTEKWKLKMDGWNHRTNVIGSDGTIYNASGKLHALNPDGTEKWVATATSGYSIFSEPSIDKDGSIYTINDAESKLYIFNPDGSLKLKGPDLSAFGATIAYERGMLIGKNGNLYVLMAKNSRNFVVALDKSGNKVWSREMKGLYLYYGMDQKGDLFTTTVVGSQSFIHKLDGKTGDILAEKMYNTYAVNNPIIDYVNGDVYINVAQKLTKFDNNLNVIWEKPYASVGEVTIDKNRDIVFAAPTGVYKLSKDGEEIWKLDYKTLAEGVLSVGQYNPTIDKEGKVYLAYSSYDAKGKTFYNLISIGDPVEQPIDFCSYYGSLEKKLNDKTLTKEEQTKAIEKTEKLLDQLKSYSAE
ncbi:hypothetical protein CON36_35665 [Bacillus cereus]|uniref:PQQ-binding-like beta-propeller repeat protein n=1 Tax=Bacillus cereus TaxID=1396 RepID=A0A9X6XVA2_BACCE|nr:PQQ-binding-like beta-propeller repeat protein [Bacillus cereus]PDZ94086.1 hypothetical protein CON36_35665 [Bacillus cereus]